MIYRNILGTLVLTASVFASSLSINTTTEGYIFSVVTGTTDNSSFQLRLRPNQYDPSLGYPLGTFHYVGIDVPDPVLIANLKDGILFSEGRNSDGSAYDLGPAGFINLKTTINTSSSYLFSFVNATIYPPALDSGWVLNSNDGGDIFELLHTEPDGVANGWRLCIADFDQDYGPWSYVEYFTYTETPTFDNYCEPVEIQAIVAK